MADTIGTYYFQLAPSTEGIGNSISKALGDEGTKSSKSFGDSFSKGLATFGKVAGAAITAAGGAVSMLTKQAVSGYAEFEQLVGGVETLFGAQGMGLEEYAKSVGKTASDAAAEFTQLQQAQNTVLANADEAYKTAGLSANDYMETVTSFAAALKQSTSSELEAANVADMAIIDMADNANKMGTSMESIQNAYQGFAKQNYTMLDNLKLGYGGTKSEMERLIADAEKMDSTFQAQRDTDGNLTMALSDVYNAIHIVQTELGITGTTAKEASSTISGSLGMLSASWQNLLVGLTDPSADIDTLIDNLVESAGTALENLLPAIEHALSGIGQLITKVAPIIADMLPDLIKDLLPALITAAMDLIGGLSDALPDIITILTDNIPALVTALLDMADNLINTIFDMLPQLIETIAQIINQIFTKIGEMLPTLIPTIIEGIILVVETLIENLPLLLDGVLTLIKGLAQGIITALPILIDALPDIIVGIVDFIIGAIPQIIMAVIEIVMAIVRALPDIILALVDALPEIIEGIVVAIVDNLPMFIEAMFELAYGLVEAIPTIIVVLIEIVPQIIASIIKALLKAAPQFKEAGKKLLTTLGEGITNTTSRMKEVISNVWTAIKKMVTGWIDSIKEIGRNIMQGLADGLKEKINSVVETMTGVCTKISDGFKNFFGINSPSKLFADYGYFMDEGLADGITDGQNVVNDAMDNLNNSLVSEISTDADITYDAGYNTRSVASNEDNGLYSLLSEYLPYLAQGSNVNVSLEGNTNGLFNLIRRADSEYRKQTGTSAFA